MSQSQDWEDIPDVSCNDLTVLSAAMRQDVLDQVVAELVSSN
jgi:hypothetical protein